MGDRREPLTVAADVDGLGAILYALMTGEPPFTGKTVLEILDHVRATEPRRPRTLNPRVDRDLELICLKALEKKPANRYPSALALAEDLDRYLADEPVLVRPVGWWERRWRWLRKHPTVSAVAATGLAAAVLLLSVIGFEAVRMARDRAALDAALGAAKVARLEAEARQQEAAAAQATAQRFQQETVRARSEALAQGQQARQSLYVGDIRLADTARQSGDSMQLAYLLDRQVPKPEEDDVRGFEWFVLDRLDRLRPARLAVPFGPVSCVAYSPDGRWIAAAGAGGVIQVFDEQRRTLERAFSPSYASRRRIEIGGETTYLARYSAKPWPPGGTSPG
jgi:hypothetical protein